MIAERALLDAEVLVADHDPATRQLITASLSRAGFRVTGAATGAEARAALSGRAIALVLLERGLPDVDGLHLLAEFRDGTDVPAIVVSGWASESDRVAGLQSGADDYIVKPFSPTELVARAQAVLRRSRPLTPPRLTFGNVAIEVAAREVFVQGARLELRSKEFDLLLFLASHPRTAFSRRQLLREVWMSAPEHQCASTVTEHVRRLRSKLEPDPKRPRHLRTVHSVGYRLDP